MVNEDVAALGAAVADTFVPFEEPGPLLEAEILAGHGPDRAEIDDIEGIAIIQRSAGKKGDPGIIGAVDNAQFAGLGDQSGEADAAGAEDAAFLVMDDAAAEIHLLSLEHLGHPHPAGLVIVGHVVVLQRTLAGLIADRTVGRVIDQLQFHDIVLDLLDLFGVELDLQPFGDRRLAGGNERRPAVFYADQAHAAVAIRTQGRMIAEVGNLDADYLEGVDEVFPRLHFNLLSVYKEFYRLSHDDSFSRVSCLFGLGSVCGVGHKFCRNLSR